MGKDKNTGNRLSIPDLGKPGQRQPHEVRPSEWQIPANRPAAPLKPKQEG